MFEYVVAVIAALFLTLIYHAMGMLFVPSWRSKIRRSFEAYVEAVGTKWMVAAFAVQLLLGGLVLWCLPWYIVVPLVVVSSGLCIRAVSSKSDYLE